MPFQFGHYKVESGKKTFKQKKIRSEKWKDQKFEET